MRGRAFLVHTGLIAAYAAVVVAFTWPLASHLSTHLPGDPGGDTGVYVWNQWIFQEEAIVQTRSPLTTDRIFSLSTRPIDLAQHNYTAFLNVLALPFTRLIGVVATFNVVMLLAMVLTAYLTFLLARDLTGGATAEAWLAGLLFACSPVLIARTTGHVSLVAAAPLPAFVLALRHADATRRTRDAVAVGLTMAWAAFCDAYFVVYCAMIGGLFVTSRVLWIEWRPGTRARSATWLLDLAILSCAGVVAGLALGGGGRFELLGVPVSVRGLYTPVLVLTALLGLRVLLWVNPRVVSDVRQLRPSSIGVMGAGIVACAAGMSPVLHGAARQVIEGGWVSPPVLWRSSPPGVDALALVTPNPNHPLVRWLIADGQAADPTRFVEYTGALSLVALAVMVAAWRAGHKAPRWYAGTTLAWALLSLGPFVYVAGINTHVPGPWAVLRYVPVIGLARMPTRFTILASLGVALLFAAALAALARQRPQRRAALVSLVGAALVFELWPAPRPLYSAAIPEFYRIVRDDPRPVRVLNLPFGARDGVTSLGNTSARYQFEQTMHQKRLIGGYLSRVSPRLVHDVQRRPVLRALSVLSQGDPLRPEERAHAVASAPAFVDRVDIGWVVIDGHLAPPELVAFAQEAFGLELVAEEGSRRLYRLTVGQ